MLGHARLRAFLSMSIIVEGATRTIQEVLGSSYNGFVFVAYDGGFLCRACVESPCTEMVDATCDYDESELPIECGQWCIVGAQEPELGHGDTCDHCGAWTLSQPVSEATAMADNDNYVDPWPLLDGFARASPNLDPRAYGGDRNGPTDCDSGAVDTTIPEYHRSLRQMTIYRCPHSGKLHSMNKFIHFGGSDIQPGYTVAHLRLARLAGESPDCEGL